MRIRFPQWNEEPGFGAQTLIRRGLLILFALTPARIFLTLVRTPSRLSAPLQNLSVSCEPMRILVAEDDAPLAEFLRQRLVQEQFSVQIVSNAAEAEKLSSLLTYDLLILDLNLPGGGGLEVLRGIRSKR